MSILFLFQELPNLAIVDWCLIATKEVSIRTDVIEITWIDTKKSSDGYSDGYLACYTCCFNGIDLN